jgi:hypothetical protein
MAFDVINTLVVDTHGIYRSDGYQHYTDPLSMSRISVVQLDSSILLQSTVSILHTVMHSTVTTQSGGGGPLHSPAPAIATNQPIRAAEGRGGYPAIATR